VTWMDHYRTEILKDLGGLIMTDKERLESIQTNWYDHNQMKYEDTTWLIEQAEQNEKLCAGLTEIIEESEEFVNFYSKEGEGALAQINLCNHFGNIATNTLGESK